MNSFVLKAAVAIAIVPLSLDVTRRFIETRIASSSLGSLTLLFMLSRIVLAVVAFELLPIKLPSDPAHYYAAVGQMVLTSGRTDASPYSPGFDYLMAGLWWLFHTPTSFIWAMIAAESAAFALTLNALRLAGEPLAAGIAALWFVSPISIFNVALGGQDEALILLATAGVLWAAARRRDALAGAWVACGLVGSKILAGFAALPLLSLPGNRIARAGFVALALTAAAAAACVAANIPVLSFLVEAQSISSGNLWALASLVSGRSGLVPAGAMLSVATAALMTTMFQMRRRPIDSAMTQMLRATGTTGCVFLLFSPKAFASYSLMFLPGILLLLLSLAPLARTALVVGFFPVTVLEPSLWFRIVPAGLSLPVIGPGRSALLLADAVLVTGYAVLAWRGLTLDRMRISCAPAVQGRFR